MDLHDEAHEERVDTSAADSRHWYVLRHPNPVLIDDVFSHKRAVSYTDVEEPLPELDYFIPFCEINFRSSLAATAPSDTFIGHKYEPKLDGDAFRVDLKSYIFVFATEHQVADILHYAWNRNLKNPMWALRDEQGHFVTVSLRAMEVFRSALRQMDFQICEGRPALEDVHEGDWVDVVDGPMKGGEGRVAEIRDRKGLLSLTVSFRLFNNIDIQVPGIRLEHVRLRNQETHRLLHDDVISNFESELIELLCHRHGASGSPDRNKADSKKLTFLNKYAGIQFDDETDAAKFEALMLICAYLMKDDAQLEQRIQRVESLLYKGDPSPFTLHSSLDCYLMTALFIATHDVTLRQRVKAYRQSHPDCPLAIRRFLSIAKLIKAKKP